MLIFFIVAVCALTEKTVGHPVESQRKNTLSVDDRIIARWTNNKYYAGKIESISEAKNTIDILFDDGDRITHPLDEVTAVFLDKKPELVEYKDHVIAPWQGSYRQYIGYVIDVTMFGKVKVRFDDNDEAWYEKDEVRILPVASSPLEVGARVFARWTNGLFYRGFVSKSTLSTVSINYDDGDKITLPKNDNSAVILDKIPHEDEVNAGQKVIGYWPGRVRYYPGYISGPCDDGKKFYLKFDDGDERCEWIYEIRTIPKNIPAKF